MAQVINLNFFHLFERLLEELPIFMALVSGVVPVERPTLLAWSELTFISMLKACSFSKTLNNGEIRMLYDDGIKPHNFRIDVDTALLSTCSTLRIEPNEMAVVLRRKT